MPTTSTLAAPSVPGRFDLPGDFLKQVAFSDGAPKRLVEAARAGDIPRFCRELRSTWPLKVNRDARGGVFPPQRIRPPRQTALTSVPLSVEIDGSPPRGSEESLWRWWTGGSTRAGGETGSSNGAAPAGENGASLPRKKRKIRPESPLAGWLRRTRETGSIASVAELLVLFDVFEEYGPALPDELLVGLWQAAIAGTAHLANAASEEAESEDDGDLRLIRSGELALKGGLFFADVEGFAPLVEQGRAELSNRLARSTDEAGVPHGAALARLGPTLATWVRAAAWATACGEQPWNNDAAAARFKGLVRSIAALRRRDGAAALDGLNATGDSSLDLAAVAARLAGWRRRSRPRMLLDALRDGVARRPTAIPDKDRRRMAKVVKPEKRPSFQSDDSLLACLRSDWTPWADFFAIAHDRSVPRIELQVRGTPALAGEWEIGVSLDGTPVALDGAWKPSCWFADDDADYLEIQMNLAGGLHVERQMLLSRHEQFLVLADCVSGPGVGRVDYRSRLPVGVKTRPEPDERTREVRLHLPGDARGNSFVRAFPLALDDDRLRSAAGSLETAGGIVLTQSGQGGLFAPIVLDWHPDREKNSADWRRLTVGEQGKSLPHDVASGHRLRIGGHQLLVYRALSRSGELRSVLGYHTPHETVIGVLDHDGDVEPLLLVE